MATLRLERLTRRFTDGPAAVDAVDLDVGQGELLALVGPSGCGKTSMLRLIAGLDSPTSGRVWIDGRDATTLPPAGRDVALAFQRPALYPQQTVLANLTAGALLHDGVSWPRRWFSAASRRRGRVIAERADAVAAILELQPLLKRLPGQLSGGQQQRVALGRVLTRQAGLTLLDEPLGNLDAPLRQELRRQLHLLQRQLGATMVVVTHDPAEALALGDRVAVMAGGRLVQVDTPAKMLQQPVNRFVAGLVGWPALAFVEASLELAGGELTLVAEPGRLVVPPELGQRWARWVRRELLLGVRPDDVRWGEPGSAEGWKLSVRRMEPLGARWLATLGHGRTEISAWTTGDCPFSGAVATIAAEKTAMVQINLASCCLFDRESGALVVARATG